MFGFFSRKKHTDEDDLQMYGSGEESEAVRYVREVIMAALDRGLDTIQITAVAGKATCILCDAHPPYVNVRNRIAIMTDSIRSYDNRTDQRGVILVKVPERAYVIAIEDRAAHGGLTLRISAQP